MKSIENPDLAKNTEGHPQRGQPAPSNSDPPSKLKRVVVYTDGGCRGNPGPGAWACVLQYGKQVLELTGGELATTNNRMELSAAIHALRALNQSCAIEIHTDSQYLRQGITDWVRGWKRNGWRTKDKQPVKNRDLWQEIDQLAAKHKMSWIWVRGHAGNRLNERCDELAGRKMDELFKNHSPEERRQALMHFAAQEA